jgi:hypothetical protein
MKCPKCKMPLQKVFMDLRICGGINYYREFFWFCSTCRTFHGNGYEKEEAKDGTRQG